MDQRGGSHIRPQHWSHTSGFDPLTRRGSRRQNSASPPSHSAPVGYDQMVRRWKGLVTVKLRCWTAGRQSWSAVTPVLWHQRSDTAVLVLAALRPSLLAQTSPHLLSPLSDRAPPPCRERWPRAPRRLQPVYRERHNRTPRQKRRAGQPSVTWSPCRSERLGCGRTGRRTEGSETAEPEPSSSDRTEPLANSGLRQATSAPASGPSWPHSLSAIHHLLDHPAHSRVPVVICNDSQSALVALWRASRPRRPRCAGRFRVGFAGVAD